MTKETSSGYTPLGVFYRCPRLMQGLSLFGGLSVLSSGLVVAQTDSPVDTGVAPTMPTVAPASEAPAKAPVSARPKPSAPETIVVPTVPVRQPLSVPAASAPVPSATTRPSRLRAREAVVPQRRATAPAPVIAVPRKPVLSAPNLSVPDASTVAKPPKILFNPTQIQESARTTIAPSNSYIDRTDYSLGATRRYDGPASVVLTERSTGCRTVSQNGQLSRGVCGIAVPRQQIANRPQTDNLPTLQEPRLSGVTRLPTPAVANVQPIKLGSLRLSPSSTRATQRTTYSPYSSSSGYSAGHQKTPTGLAYYNLTSRPIGRPNIGKTSFIFPLTIPVAITSAFGWRIHPITGDHRFHSGTDLGAPQGTPVVAAASGQVATADFLGGYGLAIVIQHEKGTQESLYGHLSEIFVQPGESVEQGTVIGRVGSTGNSTGPHLHFEWRHLTSDGWVAVDAGTHLEYALAQFINALQYAQATSQRGL